MCLKKILLLFAILFYVRASIAQQVIDNAAGYAIIESKASTYPKFYREFNQAKKTESKMKRVVFVRGTGSGTPASARPDGSITIDISFIETSVLDFDDNRLIVVLFHEIGHLYYFSIHTIDRNRDENEKFAFEYSLIRTKQLAEKGDCLPLQIGLKFMKRRSEENNLQDAHVRALKKMVTESLFSEYSQYAATCANSTSHNTTNTDNKNSLGNDIHIVNSNGNTMYYDINSPQIREQKGIFLYIVKNNSNAPKLRLCIQYSEPYPIYVTDYLINNTFKIHIDENKLTKTHNATYNSWYDIPADANILNIVKSIISSQNPILKYMGTSGTIDFQIGEKEKSALLNIITKYLSMNNQ